MAKIVTAKTKRKQIANYMETHFSDENFDVIEDILEDEDPSIIIQTDNRVVTLWCDETGFVQENFEIAEGADKITYSLKKKAYVALNTYILMNYKDAIILKDSFEKSFIKLENKQYNISLAYDFESEAVVAEEIEKKNIPSKKTASKEIEGQISLLDLNYGFEKEESEATPIVEESIKIEPYKNKNNYSHIPEGTEVKSIYSDKIYIVIEDIGNILKVRDKDKNSFQIPRSDITRI